MRKVSLLTFALEKYIDLQVYYISEVNPDLSYVNLNLFTTAISQDSLPVTLINCSFYVQINGVAMGSYFRLS